MSELKRYHIRATIELEISSTAGLMGAFAYVQDELNNTFTPAPAFDQDNPTRVKDFEIVAVESERAGRLGGKQRTSERIG
jgi:hypothetical protein